MKLFEIAIHYHKTLCPKLWDDMKLKEEVRDALLQIADSFIDTLDVKFDPEDIVLTGSLANYNWNSESDVDLHLMIDLGQYRKNCPDFVDDFFQDKKTLWNDRHDIDIYGHAVEVYVQDIKEEHAASGLYSVLNDKWIKEPEYNPPDEIDNKVINNKTKQFKDKIDQLIGSPGNSKQADKLKDEIRAYRKAGLEKEEDQVEFSTANLVFKELRKSGHMEKLVNYIRADKSEELSL